MNELILKYQLLNDLGKQEILDFLNYLLTKRGIAQPVLNSHNIALPEKSIGQLLALLGDFTDPGMADQIEAHQKNWKNWTVQTW